MPKHWQADDLLRTAETLVASNKGKPRQADLRRAISTAYYAIFHTICFNCANSVIGKGPDYPKAAWRRVYRALSHDFAKRACMTDKGNPREVLSKFPSAIQDFANTFANLQLRRYSADYDPYFTTVKSEVVADIESARQAIIDFKAAPISDRRAFASLVLFQDRK